MSSAFQRELDREDAIPDLPDRPVSTARNHHSGTGSAMIPGRQCRMAGRSFSNGLDMTSPEVG